MAIRLIDNLKLTCLGITLCLFYISCSNQTNKEPSFKGDTIVSKETVNKSQKWDIERINTYYDKNSILTRSDYDFLLDQLEIFGKQRESMTSEEFKNYFDSFNEKEASAYMLLSLTTSEANMKGKLTPTQVKRFNSLKKYLD